MIHLENLAYRYPDDGFHLRIDALRIEQGCATAIIGPSGVGKTTLLRLISGIHRPYHGHIRVDEVDVHNMDEDGRRDFRVARIGFVFQELELLDYLTVQDNIVHPYRINRRMRLDRAVMARAHELAEQTGLSGKLERMPHELSQGERQRAAVCRALLTRPPVLLADEATGNLDPANKRRIMDLLFLAVREEGATLLAVTHDHDLLPLFDRVIDIQQHLH